MTNRLILLCIAIFWVITLASGPDTKGIFERNRAPAVVDHNDILSAPWLQRTEFTDMDRSKDIWRKREQLQDTDFLLNQGEMKAGQNSTRLNGAGNRDTVHYDYQHNYQYTDNYVDAWKYEGGHNFFDDGYVEPVLDDTDGVQLSGLRAKAPAYAHEINASGQFGKTMLERSLWAILGIGLIAIGVSRMHISK